MNLRQLRYFLAVASELHFGRAAKQLSMAQPPLSMQIKQLENDLGVLLFQRNKRQVALTAAGKVLEVEAQQILERVAIAKNKTQQAARGEVGRLSIAFVSSAMYSILPVWIQSFRQQYPAVTLDFQAVTSLKQIERLLSHQVDIGIIHPPISSGHLDEQIVWQESLVVALPTAHPLSDQAQVSINDLANESFIMAERSLATVMYDNIISFCSQAKFQPNIVQTADQLQTILGLVSAQIGIAILPAAVQKLQREGICYRPFKEETPSMQLVAIWRKEECTEVIHNFLTMSPPSLIP